jgi:DNA-binding XRE family transcriptional regulator
MTDMTNRLAQGQQETGEVCLDGALEARKAQRQQREQRQAERRAAILARLPHADDGNWRKWLMATRMAVAKARKAAGVTQEEAGLLVDMSLRTYRDWEAGKSDLPSAKVVRLCGLFGMTVALPTNGQNFAYSGEAGTASGSAESATGGAAAQAVCVSADGADAEPSLYVPESVARRAHAERLERAEQRQQRTAAATEEAQVRAEHPGVDGEVMPRVNDVRFRPFPTSTEADGADATSMRHWIWDVSPEAPATDVSS